MKKIGRYEVEREIGRGAMGVVYLAHDPRVRRPVAVKTFCMPEGLDETQREEYRERFRREAHAAGRLSDPGIVTIYDVDEDDATGLPFIAMEYVPGGSLLSLIQSDAPVDPETAFAIVGAVAEALHAAHREEVVHRDIKPANIIVREPDRAVKIADFGVARVTTSELTQSGTSLGSPAYMSPEQIRAAFIDGRSDLFALGVILYEMLCGRRPFSAEDTAALAYAVAHETPVPITRRVTGLPAGLDAFFDRALAKKPEDRFPDGASFKAALEQARKATAADVGASTVIASEAQPGEALPQSVVGVAGRDDPLPFGQLDSQRMIRRRRSPMVVMVLAAVLVLSSWIYLSGRNQAYLQLDGKSGIEAGELVVRIDGEKVYSRRLSAPRQGLLKKMLEQNQESFETRIKVSPGKHEVMASIMPDGADSAYRDSVVVDLESGETRRLRLVAGRALGSRLSLKVH